MHKYLALLFVLLLPNLGSADVRPLAELLAEKRVEFDSTPGGCEPSGTPPLDPSLPEFKSSEHQERAFTDHFNSLEGEREICARTFVEQYRAAVLDYCEATCLGAYVAGGCEHIVIYSVHDGVLYNALKACP